MWIQYINQSVHVNTEQQPVLLCEYRVATSLLTFQDVEFNVDEKPDTFMGEDIEVALKVKNNSKETRTVNGTLSLSSMYYTGVFYKQIEKLKLENIVLEPQSGKFVTMSMPVNEVKVKDIVTVVGVKVAHIRRTMALA